MIELGTLYLRRVWTWNRTHLHELEVGVVSQLRVFLEELEGVVRGAERVHEHEAHVALEALAHLDHLHSPPPPHPAPSTSREMARKMKNKVRLKALPPRRLLYFFTVVATATAVRGALAQTQTTTL